MTRGNQREMARAKAAKKDKGSAKAATDQKANQGLSKEQRMQRDADKMRAKQKEAHEAGRDAKGIQIKKGNWREIIEKVIHFVWKPPLLYIENQCLKTSYPPVSALWKRDNVRSKPYSAHFFTFLY